MKGYGSYGQVWELPAKMLDKGTLSSYPGGCVSCSTGFGNLKKEWVCGALLVLAVVGWAGYLK